MREQIAELIEKASHFKGPEGIDVEEAETLTKSHSSLLDISAHDLGNITTIQGTGQIEEHPKYKALETLFNDKEGEVLKLQTYALDLESKL